MPWSDPVTAKPLSFIAPATEAMAVPPMPTKWTDLISANMRGVFSGEARQGARQNCPMAKPGHRHGARFCHWLCSCLGPTLAALARLGCETCQNPARCRPLPERAAPLVTLPRICSVRNKKGDQLESRSVAKAARRPVGELRARVGDATENMFRTE